MNFREKETDMIIDRYIRKHAQELDVASFDIEPSENFCQRVMMKTIDLEKDRSRITTAFLAFIALIPFIIREIWMLLRNDYFSVIEWPLGENLFTFYSFLISPTAFYLFLFSGIVVATGIFFKKWGTIRNTHTKLARP